MPGYVAVRIVFMVFIKVDFISYMALVFSKAVVDLSRGFEQYLCWQKIKERIQIGRAANIGPVGRNGSKSL